MGKISQTVLYNSAPKLSAGDTGFSGQHQRGKPMKGSPGKAFCLIVV